jgi:hypothetical protein
MPALLMAIAVASPVYGQATPDSSSASVPNPVRQHDPASAPVDLEEVTVNGIRYRDTILPTRLSSTSTYGLDLNVMDTPRNTTLLSTTQLDTLNIKDPRAFSYLTSSSYTDSGFGTPNIPRIRGQYSDVFYNGMRSPFTSEGYGVPLNFDSFENIDITKGPASVVDGPGPGVGGQADFLTKRPNLLHDSLSASSSLDSVNNRRLMVDTNRLIEPGELAVLLSYSGEYSGSYFTDHYMHKSALYGALRWTPSSQYQLDFNTEVNYEVYTENAGVNRVSQDLIDNRLYWQGAPNGELYSTLYGGAPLPIGSPGNPYSPTAPFLTTVGLTNEVGFNTRNTIDLTPGTISRGLLYTAQLIQTYHFSDALSINNNTFLDFQNSDNREAYYYADTCKGCISIENRTLLNYESGLPFSIGGERNSSEVAFGATFRYTHIHTLLDWNIETPNVFDLTSNSNLWRISPDVLTNYGDSYPVKSAFGVQQFAVPGRDPINAGATGDSQVYDGAVFLQQRAELTPQIAFLYGGRVDEIQAHSHDPLGGATCCAGYSPELLPQNRTTSWFTLYQANSSLVYRPREWLSGYLTADFTQSTNPNGAFGGINLYGQVPDKNVMRTTNYLYEGGLKFNLLNDKLFMGTAVFDQQRAVPIGQGATQTSRARIIGGEFELNFQPNPNFFTTASYSYLKTRLSQPAPFYNYPAEGGTYIDGAGLLAVFVPGQKFDDPGIPHHLFNFLANYKMANGLGLRTGVQVTGPVQLTQSGQLDLGNSLYVPASIVANGGYYHSPVIPWQYTWNAAVFKEIGNFTATLSVYNLTNRLNWQASPPYYGNDFLVRNDPRTVELRVQLKL